MVVDREETELKAVFILNHQQGARKRTKTPTTFLSLK
jgi:hypothetical protein